MGVFESLCDPEPQARCLVAAVVRVSPKQRASLGPTLTTVARKTRRIMIVYFIIFLKQTPTVPLNSRLREQFFCGHEQFWKILKFSLDVPIRMNLQ